MPSFTAKDVQSLRQATGAGMMDAKKALEANDGDMEAAATWLREKGLASSAKRSDRENVQGCLAVASSPAGVAYVELKCETDFVAKSPDFVALAQEMADRVLADGEDAASQLSERVDNLKITLKENIEIGRVARFAAADGHVVDSYLHVQNDRGVNAVLVDLEGGSAELAHDLAVHVAFTKPGYRTREEVPAAAIEAERATLENLTRNEGKPEQAIPKIVDGRLNGWFAERVLLEQRYVRDEKQTITQLLGPAKLVRFSQAYIGA